MTGIEMATGKRLDELADLFGIIRVTTTTYDEIINDKGENNMAKLSERVTATPNVFSQPYSTDRNELPTNINTGEPTMTNQLRTLNLTLVDNNPNLKAAEKIVFQSLCYVTEHSDDRTIQQILMSGKVADALEKHNTKRVKVVDKQIQRNTGRDVMLEEVEIFDLTWQVVRIA